MLRWSWRQARLAPDSIRSLRDPSFAHLVSQAASLAQTESPLYRAWLAAIRETNATHRKVWEWCFILEALRQNGAIRTGARGLGFGVGREPLTAALAAYDMDIVATDQPEAESEIWTTTAEYAASVDQLRNDGICDPEMFRRHVTYRPVDMRAVPGDLGTFDFLWSSCCFEHLGSIDAGLEFVVDSMKLLRPGGIAVHTTELDLADNDPAVHVQDPDTVFYRRRDLEALVLRLRRDGHHVQCNFRVPRKHGADAYVDRPPYRHDPHLRLEVNDAVATSFGLVIEAGARR